MTFSVRTTKELYRWLKALAAKNGRSMTRQVEWMLQQLHDAEDRKGRRE